MHITRAMGLGFGDINNDGKNFGMAEAAEGAGEPSGSLVWHRIFSGGQASIPVKY